MDNRTFKTILCEGPAASLLEAVDNSREHKDILTLLDAELRRSSLRLQRLKEYRNSLSSPMYRLQPELLSRIFSIYAHDNNELFDLQWTRLLYVCRRWHDVATHAQSLWSYIEINAVQKHARIPSHISSKPEEVDARDVRRIEIQRTRAGLCPLTVKMGMYANCSLAKQVYTSMFWNPDSLASLTVNGDQISVHKIVQTLAAHRHTTLKTLTLYCLSRNPGALANMQEPLGIALKENLPLLQHLSILALPIDWSLIRGLRRLSVDYMSTASLSYSPQDIIAALGRCPLLELLSLRLPPTMNANTLEHSTPVTLPRLKIVSLRGAAGTCTDLLRSLLRISQSAKVIVDITSTIANPPSISSLATYTGRHALREGNPVIRSIALALMSAVPELDVDIDVPNLDQSNSRLEIVGQLRPTRFREEMLRHRAISVAPEKDSCVTLMTMIPSVAVEEVLGGILQSWPLSKVTHVDLRLADVSIQHLEAIFAQLPYVTTVIVRPEAPNASNLLDFLERQLREHGRRIVANVLFDAADVSHRRMPHIWDGTPQVVVEVLARLFTMRAVHYCSRAARAGVPLNTIGIFNEPNSTRRRLIDPTGDIDWSELYRDLKDGFVYEGVLHSAMADRDGLEKDSFAV